MITKQRLAPGEYRYGTPMGSFGVTRTVEGWSLQQWTPAAGTTTYGIFETQRDLDAALADLFA
ncbi:hypothetical protein I5G59_gp99 [Mycobacterium phage LilMcDreamy]|uniref:Uncharacterized protein n=1 Tax=Mycobacterium phage LilMcDreamy TaxID=2652422 RepID=A0A5P8D8P9_9CAUD|nr:hypothetical protein I5G59_gp99 [Mycobacterium phage LilMcDreamy]QFP94719.1 hypothetical protein SEA_LILMCDREAMY_99 [Mycobacterium phage LilMcDreamy]